MLSKEEYEQRRNLVVFNSWVNAVVRAISDDPELTKKCRARATSNTILNKFSSEAVPLWIYFKNRGFSEDIDVALSSSDTRWDAEILDLRSQRKTKIQITTTFTERMAATLLHLNEHGDAPITHDIQTRVGLAKWKKKKSRLDPVAVDTRGEVERELDLAA
jgi:hypothetical protein